MKIFWPLKRSMGGFTLVELLVVIAIIAILATVGAVIFSNILKSARDTKRKADLDAIYKALEIYHTINGKYPQARNSSRTCSYGTNCYVYSTEGSSWVQDLVPDYMREVAIDPKNNANGPWVTGNYSYAYGNVSTDGQYYDLTTQLENTADPDRCELKNYRWFCSNGPWCVAWGGSYSNYI